MDGKGRLDLDEYKKLLTDKVAVVSVMWANNETGTFFPVVEMAELANAAGAMFHTDAVQAVGKVPMNLKDTKIDMLSVSGHKLHAPKGIGVLYLQTWHALSSIVARWSSGARSPCRCRRTALPSSAWARQPRWRWKR